MEKYTECLSCLDFRSSKLFAEAKGCHKCNGSGIIISNEIPCNNCGGSLLVDKEHGEQYIDGLIDAKVSGGYFSNHLSDCRSYNFSLCEKCLRKMFDEFKIPPTVKDYLHGNDVSYAEDQDWYRYTVWRDSGGKEAKLPTGICNYREYCQAPVKYRKFISGFLTSDSYCEVHAKEVDGCGNLIPINSVPFEVITEADKRKVVEAWLKAAIVSHDVAASCYMPDCVADLIGFDKDYDLDKFGILWFANSIDVDNYHIKPQPTFKKIEFNDGCMVLGPKEELDKAYNGPTQRSK
jgi:hypothetical protein